MTCCPWTTSPSYCSCLARPSTGSSHTGNFRITAFQAVFVSRWLMSTRSSRADAPTRGLPRGMVRKLKGSWWVDFQVHGKRYRLRSPDNHRDGAQTYEAHLRRQLSDGKSVYLSADPRRVAELAPTLDAFAADWLATYASPRLKPSTYRDYSLRYEHHLKPALGSLPIDAINTRAIDQLSGVLLRKGLHPKSANNVLGVLRRMLMSAVEWGMLPALPLVKWLKSPPSRFDFLTPLEAEALLNSVTREPWRLMMMTALHSGLRLGELVALRWDDIDFERGQLCVRRSCTRGIETSPKNNRIRYVPLTDELARALNAAGRTEGYVFEVRGQQVTQAMAWRALQTARTHAGLRHIGWHTMRHSFASHLVSENVPIVAVQMLLGHSDIKMTQRYAHVAPSLLRGAVQQIVTARERANADRRQPAVNRTEQEANTPLLGTGAQLVDPLR